MLLNAKVTAFTASEVLRENQLKAQQENYMKWILEHQTLEH